MKRNQAKIAKKYTDTKTFYKGTSNMRRHKCFALQVFRLLGSSLSDVIILYLISFNLIKYVMGRLAQDINTFELAPG